MALTKADFQKRQQKRREVTLDDGTVWVRALTAAEVGEYVKLHNAKAEEIDQLVWLVVHAACDEAGAPIFDGADADLIKGLDVGTVRTIAEAAGDVSGLADDAKKKAVN